MKFESFLFLLHKKPPVIQNLLFPQVTTIIIIPHNIQNTQNKSSNFLYFVLCFGSIFSCLPVFKVVTLIRHRDEIILITSYHFIPVFYSVMRLNLQYPIHVTLHKIFTTKDTRTKHKRIPIVRTILQLQSYIFSPPCHQPREQLL